MFSVISYQLFRTPRYFELIVLSLHLKSTPLFRTCQKQSTVRTYEQSWKRDKLTLNLPCRYRAQKKSWMDSSLFEEWVREQDRKFERQGRKIALIVDNCPAHPQIANLKAIHLVFLPPHSTSKTQPMDQCYTSNKGVL